MPNILESNSELDKLKAIFLYILSLLRKIFIFIFIFYFVLITLIFTLLQISYIQKKVTDYVLTALNQQIDYPISIGGVNISLTAGLLLNNVEVNDNRNEKMIEAKTLELHYKLISLLGRDIVVKEAIVYEPKVNLKYYDDIDDINISDFILSLKHMGKKREDWSKPSPPHVGRYTNFIIKKLTIKNGIFSYLDEKASHSKDRFDFTDFKLDSIDAEASTFKLVADTISFKIEKLKCRDQFSKLKIKKMQTDFGICENYMKLNNLKCNIGESYVSDNVEFSFFGFRQLGYIQDSVDFDLKFKNVKIRTKELAYFIPEIGYLNETWTGDANIKGKFYDLNISNSNIKFGKSSKIQGNVKIKGLPNVTQLFYDADIEKASLLPNDLRKYGIESIYTYAEKFKFIDINGKFKGVFNDFETDFEATTELGTIKSNFSMKFEKVENFLNEVKYEGILNLDNFKLGELIDQKPLKKISLNYKVNGKGLIFPENMLNASGFVTNLEYESYKIHSIFSSIRYKNKKGDIHTEISDSLAQVDLIGVVDLNPSKKNLNFNLSLKKADFQKLFGLPYPVYVTTDAKMNWQNMNAPNTNFDLVLKNVEVFNKKLHTQSDGLRFNFNKNENTTSISCSNQWFEMEANGKFDLEKGIQKSNELLTFLKEKYFNIQKNNNIKKVDFEGLNEIFSINFSNKNADELLAIIYPEISFSDELNSKFEISLSENTKINGYIETDTFKVAKLQLIKNKLEVDINFDKKNIATEVSLKSTTQVYDGNEVTQNLDLAVKSQNEITDFQLKLKQYELPNELDFEGRLKQNETSKSIHINKASLQLFDDTWSISKQNAIEIKENSIGFQDFKFSADQQQIEILGELNSTIEQQLAINILEFKLKNLSNNIKLIMGGTLNANIQVSNFQHIFKIDSKIKADSVKINKLLVGNILASSTWVPETKLIDLNIEIMRRNGKMFDLKGTYSPQNNDLDIKSAMNKTNLNILEPFLSGLFSNLNGEATGNINIVGKLNKPQVTGEIEVENGAMMINYLKTTYYFDEKIAIKADKFLFNDIVLRDENGGLAVIEGEVKHKNFSDFTYKIGGEFKNIEVLNTTFKDNSTYYGKAFGTGSFSLAGDMKGLSIELKAQSQKNTKLYIPYNQNMEVEKQEFIKFVNKSKSAKYSEKSQKEDEESFKVKTNLEFDIQPDSYLEYILDPITGDKIAGYGNGRIKLDYDSEADFNMYGNFEFDANSYYLFTFLNIINKKFTIEKGSRISWNGNPYAGLMNVTARYEDRVSLDPLVDTLSRNKPGVKTPYPVATILYLKGELMKPEISYDIKIYDYPSVISGVSLFNAVSAFENKIRNNTNEMNTQVFSLLVFRRFLYNTSGMENAAGSTVSELLTNQLSQVVSQLDKNLQVDLRMNGFSQSALNAMQVRVSYQFLDGKIRVTRSGAISNAQSQTNTSSIIGDISVEYMLTNDGMFRLKGFTRQNPNALSINSGSQGNLSTGASIMHSKSFDNFLFFRRKKTKKK